MFDICISIVIEMCVLKGFNLHFVYYTRTAPNMHSIVALHEAKSWRSNLC